MAYGTRSVPLEANSSRTPSDDIVFYVGKHRQPYHVNSESLIRSSAYFRNLLDVAPHMGVGRSARLPIVIDCEEGIFESLLLLMRYGTLEALPACMSAAEIFRLKKEADYYGIRYTAPCLLPKSEAAHSDDCSSDHLSACSSPCCSSPSGSPKSMMNMSPPAGRGSEKRASHGRYYEGVRLACNTPGQLRELPEFPLDLTDPARLLLVSCLDQERASIYTCDCVASTRRRHSAGIATQWAINIHHRHSAGIATQWAINIHHRHAFCTACGCAPNVSPKHFAEMFMAAAAHYNAAASQGKAAAWRVSSDSTCTLRFIGSAGNGHDVCGCSAGGVRAAPTIWAANGFYSHAFCTGCGEAAKGAVLLSLMLALRYGGSNIKVSGSTRSSSPKADS